MIALEASTRGRGAKFVADEHGKETIRCNHPHRVVPLEPGCRGWAVNDKTWKTHLQSKKAEKNIGKEMRAKTNSRGHYLHHHHHCNNNNDNNNNNMVSVLTALHTAFKKSPLPHLKKERRRSKKEEADAKHLHPSSPPPSVTHIHTQTYMQWHTI